MNHTMLEPNSATYSNAKATIANKYRNIGM